MCNSCKAHSFWPQGRVLEKLYGISIYFFPRRNIRLPAGLPSRIEHHLGLVEQFEITLKCGAASLFTFVESMLGKEDLERYSRQIVLRGIGQQGQLKIKKAKVCIAGVGGLGCVSAMQLAAMGVGSIRLVDRDIVDVANLHRQHLYDVASLGYPKVEVATKKILALNPNVEVDLRTLSVDFDTAEKVAQGVDVVVDGLDRFASRYAINRACLKFEIPYVFGGAIEYYGNVSTIVPRKTACLECFLGKVTDERLPTCENVGVLASVVGVVASIQVREALSIVLGTTPSLANRLMFCDLDSMMFETFPVARRDECPACSTYKEVPTVSEGVRVAELCGKNAFIVTPKRQFSVDLERAMESLVSKFKVKIRSQLGITFDYSSDISISLMRTGNMLIKGVNTQEEALRIYDQIASMFKNR